jgi:GalNAc5-diNAcBac-PP-undecaprenol beta-1,3-glucosyltransferase
VNSPSSKAPVFFSVVVPTYNRAHLLPKTIDSILAQEYGNFELIVVDDGSTDKTAEAVEKYRSDPRFHYYYKENAERGAARNFGFRKAKGEYVFFIDSDDLMLPGHLVVLNQKIASLGTKPDFLAPGFEIINPDGTFNYPGHPFSEGWYGLDIILKGNYFACLVTVRRDNPSLVLYTEDRSLAVMEDWIFLAQNLERSKIYVLDKKTIHMVEHDQRSMADNMAVIRKREKATRYILDHVKLDASQRGVLRAYSNYFCAVHSTIEGRKRLAFGYLAKACTGIPLKKSISLATKLVIGKKAFRWIKNQVKGFSS